MRDEDGPITLNEVSTFSDLENFDGTFLITGTTLYVHSYGNRAPSDLVTDFVAGTETQAWSVSQDYLVLENLKLWYSMTPAFIVLDGAENNTLRKL